nr:CapA family protein [uncultured Capnocytophaga sp.]
MIRILFFLLTLSVTAQESGNRLTLLFVGDVMGHMPQVEGAYNAETKQYDYTPVFDKIRHKFAQYDFTIANLEVTLAGKPYKGYPQFSSPDALATGCKDSGIDVMVTANNHTCDRGKAGIIRTLDVLDSLKIAHTGTFRDRGEFEKKNLLVLSKNGVSVGILNYTYGTNGLPVPAPTIVNRIDFDLMKQDIEKAKKASLDKLIVVIHWGIEYQQKQNKQQEEVAKFLFENGVDIIIGGHPHVLQPMYYSSQTGLHKEQFVVYSLGNFVSNQRKSPSDGGAMVGLTLFKDSRGTRVIDKGYYLVWVNRTRKANHKYLFEILPCKEYEKNHYKDLSEEAKDSMNIFISNSRKLFKNNVRVEEKE